MGVYADIGKGGYPVLLSSNGRPKHYMWVPGTNLGESAGKVLRGRSDKGRDSRAHIFQVLLFSPLGSKTARGKHSCAKLKTGVSHTGGVYNRR